MSMDISDFYQTFFDEADELLADMEQHLLELDPLAPDIEPLNAIFRAAHSIKGGAATFGFSVLQETTHLLENLLDGARRQEMSLSTEIINLFLETKDIMQEQLDAYKTSQQPDAESFEYICQALRQLALEAQQQQEAPAVQPAVQQPVVQHAAAPAAIEGGMRISLNGLKASEIPLMLEELGNLGEVKDPHQTEHSLDVTLLTSASEDDISAVLCFVLEPEQISFSTPTQSEPAAVEASLPEAVAVPEPAPAPVASAVPPAAKPAAAAAFSVLGDVLDFDFADRPISVPQVGLANADDLPGSGNTVLHHAEGRTDMFEITPDIDRDEFEKTHQTEDGSQ